MSIFKSLKATWSSMTTVEKVGTVLNYMAIIGGACIGSDIAYDHINRCSTKVGKACVFVAGVGIGGYIGDQAGQKVEETVKAIAELNEMRKQAKAEKEAK